MLSINQGAGPIVFRQKAPGFLGRSHDRAAIGDGFAAKDLIF
jgi:hypothetical protein